MNKQVQDTTLVQEWQELPASRRHLYFYVLLLLTMILANNLRGPRTPQVRITENPPPVPSSAVYPAPVSR